MERSAIISDCGHYRYVLHRHWGPATSTKVLPYVGANPSTADALVDDNTIRREVGFARRRGCDGLVKVNVGAYRSTNPRGCPGGLETFGPMNALHLGAIAGAHQEIVVAWGKVADPTCVRLALEIFQRAGCALLCFGINGDGSPRHPLRLPNDTPLVPWKVVLPC